MSISTEPSIWNAVEIAIRGEKRSSAHSRSACGSCPSNSTESSPASSSSSTSYRLTPPFSFPGAGCYLASRRLPFSRPGRLAAREGTELVVRRPVAEGTEGLAGQTRREPAGDEPLHGRVQLLGRDAPEDRPGDRRARAEPAAQEHVVRLPPPALLVAGGRSLEAEVADPVLRACVRA